MIDSQLMKVSSRKWRIAALVTLSAACFGLQSWPALTPSANALGAKVVAGRASVIDGDTIVIHGQRIRLHGIDAPESEQLCRDGEGQRYRCGQKAAQILDHMVSGHVVHCVQEDVDRYGRVVGTCITPSADLNGIMVSTGWALAYRQYSKTYVPAEEDAQRQKAGIWAGEFVAPWNWRRGERLEVISTSTGTSTECQIKGNISSNGRRIFHIPGQQHYDRTRIDKSKGERWFCSAAEAEAAGWRAAKH